MNLNSTSKHAFVGKWSGYVRQWTSGQLQTMVNNEYKHAKTKAGSINRYNCLQYIKHITDTYHILVQQIIVDYSSMVK